MVSPREMSNCREGRLSGAILKALANRNSSNRASGQGKASLWRGIHVADEILELWRGAEEPTGQLLGLNGAVKIHSEILQRPHVGIRGIAYQRETAAVRGRDTPSSRRAGNLPLLPQDVGTPFQIDIEESAA